MPYSTVFNAACYLANYPGLRRDWLFKLVDGNWTYSSSDNHKGRDQFKISDDPAKHWQVLGQLEGRVPGCMLPGTVFSPQFDGDAYLARYPDVRDPTFGYSSDPQGHYLKYGQKEGRIPGYEIITQTALNNTTGVFSPGTVLIIDDTTPTDSASGKVNLTDLQKDYLAQTQGAGDETVIPPPPDTTDTTNTPIDTTSQAFDLNTFITANPVLIAAIAGAIILLISTGKKRKR